jgi:hypothetical protein
MKLSYTFCRPIMLCCLNCITETIEVTEVHKYFPQGMYVGLPCSEMWTWFESDPHQIASIIFILNFLGSQLFMIKR